MAYRRESAWSKELRHRYAAPDAPVRGNVKSEPAGMFRTSAGELRIGNGREDDRPRLSGWARIMFVIRQFTMIGRFWGLIR
jgi:hypothetical protein